MLHRGLDSGHDPAAPGLASAVRTFTAADQAWFTALSGDRNPLHLASYAGRPGFPQNPVVHGIHALLWALDGLFEQRPDLPPIAALRVRFEKPVHVGDGIATDLVQCDDRKLRLNGMRGGERVASIHLTFGPPRQEAAAAGCAPLVRPEAPRELSFADLAGTAARVPFAREPLDARFPGVVRRFGRHRVASLVCSSVVVGMVCPGFHALYAGLDLAATTTDEKSEDDETLRFEVHDTDERFGRVVLAVAGGGWTGTLDTLYRPR